MGDGTPTVKVDRALEMVEQRDVVQRPQIAAAQIGGPAAERLAPLTLPGGEIALGEPGSERPLGDPRASPHFRRDPSHQTEEPPRPAGPGLAAVRHRPTVDLVPDPALLLALGKDAELAALSREPELERGQVDRGAKGSHRGRVVPVVLLPESLAGNLDLGSPGKRRHRAGLQ